MRVDDVAGIVRRFTDLALIIRPLYHLLIITPPLVSARPYRLVLLAVHVLQAPQRGLAELGEQLRVRRLRRRPIGCPQNGCLGFRV
jgi:hypothetical protein